MLRIYAISGSLQKASCNSGILRALINHKHPSLNIEVADIHDVPLFNEDVEKVGVPDAMKRISQKVRAADGLIFAIPENNYSPSAPMKNTYDWLSRG
jgi:chromate reductase